MAGMNPIFLTVSKCMLEELGFDVLAAEDGREAIRIFAEHTDRIVGVVLDLTMPHMDGEETFHELRQISDQVRVLLVSGYAEEDVESRFADEPIAGFIHKPYQFSVLKAKLYEMLGE